MSLAPYIHAMGRGPSRARSLTQDEARDAMAQILRGEAAPEAIGALLMLMRYRGETPGEVAGFTEAARARMGAWPQATLDWPSYAAGRSRGLPWFLLSAMVLARAGMPVLLHGWNSHQNPVADVRRTVVELGIPMAQTPDAAETALRVTGIAYVPLEAMAPELHDLLRLREVLGLRSIVNTVCRMLNPGGAATMVQGVFHPSYRALQQEAATLLGQHNLSVIKGGGGEFERHPAKACTFYALAKGRAAETVSPPLLDEHRRLAEAGQTQAHLAAVWRGEVRDPWGEAIITGTTALALRALAPELDDDAALRRAQDLWQNRHRRAAA